jgi:drug/metabolite transporter (DMT)-like permease
VSLEVTLVVLLAAAMHAVWNALVKASSDRLVELAALNLAAGLFGLALLPLVGWPGRPAAPFLATTVFCHLGYYTFLLLSYSTGGLSLVYPIARGAAPLIVALLSGVVLGERLAPAQNAGVALIALGILTLAFSGGLRRLHARAVGFSLLTGVTIAAYTFADGSGVRAARTPLSYTACLFAMNGLLLLPPLLVLRRGRALERLRAQWRTGLVAGALSLGAYGLALWAMTRGTIALVAALRETSVVLAALIGATFLGEPFGRYRVVASLAVASGILVLRVAG